MGTDGAAARDATGTGAATGVVELSMVALESAMDEPEALDTKLKIRECRENAEKNFCFCITCAQRIHYTLQKDGIYNTQWTLLEYKK